MMEKDEARQALSAERKAAPDEVRRIYELATGSEVPA